MPRQYLTNEQQEFLRSIDRERSQMSKRGPSCMGFVLAGATILRRLVRSIRRAWFLRMPVLILLAFTAQSSMAQNKLDNRFTQVRSAHDEKVVPAEGSHSSLTGGCPAKHEEQAVAAQTWGCAREFASTADEERSELRPGTLGDAPSSFYMTRELSVGAACFLGTVILLVLLRSGNKNVQVPPARPSLKVRAPVAQPPTPLPPVPAHAIVRPISIDPPVGVDPGPSDLMFLARKVYAWKHPEHKSNRVGFVTRRGNVRPYNEDRGVGFVINERALLIIADGMGGLVGGDIAAALAVDAAAARAIEIYGGAAGKDLDPASVAAISLGAAQREIMRKIAAGQCGQLADGCRTTLIIVVVDFTKSSMGYAYIGDGGGCVRRAAGHVENFVEPMKVHPGSNAIFGSLGPQLDGELASGNLAIDPGDFVIAGTDGVFDRVGAEDLAAGVTAAITECGGDLQDAVSLIVDDFVEQRDDRGYLVDDNASLGVIAVPKPELESAALIEVVEQVGTLREARFTHGDLQGHKHLVTANGRRRAK